MDITAISILGFSLFFIVIWICIIALGLYGILKIKKAQSQNPNLGLLPLLMGNKTIIIVWTILLVVGVVVTARESAFRPKTVIDAPNPEREKMVQAIDESPEPVIKKSEPRYDSQEAMKKNREENQKAIEDFSKLPDAD